MGGKIQRKGAKMEAFFEDFIEAYPTPYPDINRLLSRLSGEVRSVLNKQMVGLYLYGSLAGGEFNPETSDVDFLVVTDGRLPPKKITDLAEMHAGLAASNLKYTAKLEGSYLDQAALPRYDPEDLRPWPTLNEGRFYLAPHGWDWVIQRHILRKQGVVVSGPDLLGTIAPVAPDELRGAVRELLLSWWAPLLKSPEKLHRDDYQAYAVLSMCRSLHTLHSGTIASKPQAALWAVKALGEQWAELIQQALEWRPGREFNRFEEAVALIHLTLGNLDKHTHNDSASP
jgi:predicted nucleotidyltransferase